VLVILAALAVVVRRPVHGSPQFTPDSVAALKPGDSIAIEIAFEATAATDPDKR
jgi:hypothetical protein